MNFRSILAGLLCISAQATLTASNLYDFGTITGNNAGNGISLASETTPYKTNSTVPWFEDTTGSPTGEQIDCVVALAVTTNTCGNPGPGSAVSIPIHAIGNTPPGVTNYFLTDGDPQYGAPVSVDLTGLIANASYTISFYQSSNEETNVTSTAYDDSWEVYVLPGASSGVYLCPQAYCATYSTKTTVDASDLAFTSTNMQNPGGAATNWVQQTFNFTVPNATTSVILEFVANVETSTGTALAANVNFMPPLLALADVTLTNNSSTPEPSTWGLTILGGALIFGAGRLRRRFEARGRA